LLLLPVFLLPLCLSLGRLSTKKMVKPL
jgi:hypothetical protein